MSDRAPAPGEQLHDGSVTVPRSAATVVLLRDGDAGLEVLLTRRTLRARFMAGAWVFPGGAVDPGDGEGQSGLRAAAAREVREEAGIDLGPDCELVAFSNWITPAQVKIRYDTWFYLALMPAGQEPAIDGDEIVDARWMRPADALAAARAGEILIVVPTAKQLERLSEFSSADELLSFAQGRSIEPVQPRVIGSGEQARIVLPGEPGYDE
jgi:8-oxo-dGTP pyrophosphatase MutT (NUDIX family)